MHLSGTIMEIWCLKDDAVMTLTFRGSLAVVDFLWVVHCDHASIWHRYSDMAPQRQCHVHRHTHNDGHTDITTNLIIFFNVH